MTSLLTCCSEAITMGNMMGAEVATEELWDKLNQAPGTHWMALIWTFHLEVDSPLINSGITNSPMAWGAAWPVMALQAAREAVQVPARAVGRNWATTGVAHPSPAMVQKPISFCSLSLSASCFLILSPTPSSSRESMPRWRVCAPNLRAAATLAASPLADRMAVYFALALSIVAEVSTSMSLATPLSAPSSAFTMLVVEIPVDFFFMASRSRLASCSWINALDSMYRSYSLYFFTSAAILFFSCVPVHPFISSSRSSSFISVLLTSFWAEA
mmetsp:Transcript_55776/g.122157  ORF Transcript_55776/g.122157 Transcript_55776/m.122157 type:complete len:271 (-) Transcript_55776:269-1081(-)